MIRGVGAPSTVAGGARQVREGGGFRLPKAEAGVTAGIAGTAAVGTSAMLALQELPDPQVADREARRRGQDLLEALAALQRALLGAGGADADALARLADDIPQAADPALRAAVAAIALRARIEAARLQGPGAAESS